MRTSNTALRLEPELKQRVEQLAAADQRSFSALVREALQRYVEQREAEQAETREALAAWQAYQRDGLHVTGEALSAWLRSWGTEQEGPPPESHP